MAYSRRPRTFTADTMGGVWRKLSSEGGQHRLQPRLGQRRDVGRAPHGARHVQGVRLQPETHHRVVGLVPLGEEPGQLGGFAEGHGQDAGGQGVERPGVAGLADAGEDTHPPHHLEGGGPGMLVNDEKPVHSFQGA